MAACARVIDSGQYIQGPEVEAFEAAAAALCQVPFALGVSSGTDALLLALMALEIGAGDEVICPTYSFFATAGSIWRLGAKPVFVDVCPGCYTMQVEQVDARLSRRTRAIMPVHLFGQMAAMAPLRALAQVRGLGLVEDAAQALGASCDGTQAGSGSDVGCFSFFPSKNLGAFGDAGLVTTQSPELAARLRVLRVHGAAPKYHHALVGGNFRMDALQAALLRVKLPLLGASTAARQDHAAAYDRLFGAAPQVGQRTCTCAGAASPRSPDAAAIRLPPPPRGQHIYNQYVLEFTAGQGMRDHVRQSLIAAGIGCEVYYPVPLHRQACFASILAAQGPCPVADRAAASTLALPIYPELQTDEQARVVAAVCAATATGPSPA